VEEYPRPKIPEKAPLNFKKLVDGILDFQIGLNTAPVALQAELRNSEDVHFVETTSSMLLRTLALN
jgi:hypothetical protein